MRDRLIAKIRRSGKPSAALAQMTIERMREAMETIQLEPTNPQPHLALARMYADDGNWVEALKHYELAAQKGPSLNLTAQINEAREKTAKKR